MDPDIPEEDQRYLGYGRVASCLPYLMQDGYRRDLQPMTFRTAVLENDILRAIFLLELGGRLWSLLHKPSGRELLEVNPVFQPANLAIRNAWFSGGVEWNIGIRGHCPFTCSPLFAARVEGPNGSPVLRLYEWERVRQVPFQLDAYLPDGSPVLFVRPRIANPHDREVPMYWWSNMAVPETPDTRVVVPADHAYRFAYARGLARVPVPEHDGLDGSYPARVPRSMDFFFRVGDGRRPWIAALDDDGRGLAQTSTPLLKGRKLFVWGSGPGGRRWQEFLARPGCAYIEIQAGLARTQAEHIPMPARAEWEWLEAYGLLEADPEAVHGPDWRRAQRAVQAQLHGLIPADQLDAEFERGGEIARRVPLELLHRGSGWGALERLRREAAGEPPFCGPELAFDEASLAEPQHPWQRLLDTGELPDADPGTPPRSYLVQPEWRELLDESIRRDGASHWLAWLHLGVMRYHAGDRAGAREAWDRAQSLNQNPWALRNLAVLAREDEQHDRAGDLLIAAARLQPDLRPLVVECGKALLAAGRGEDWLGLVQELPEPVRSAGRVVLLEGEAALSTGDLERVERVLSEAREIEDLREGEVSLSNLWYGLHERRISAAEGVPVDDALRQRVREQFPPPAHIDFRMHT
jgi:hypothetical protein